jgi:hypothetical protein
MPAQEITEPQNLRDEEWLRSRTGGPADGPVVILLHGWSIRRRISEIVLGSCRTRF